MPSLFSVEFIPAQNKFMRLVQNRRFQETALKVLVFLALAAGIIMLSGAIIGLHEWLVPPPR
jgi:hypothetical protein